MERELIIYDNNGTILTMQSGVDSVPTGIQGMVVELGDREYIDYLDMSTNPPTPVIKKGNDPEALDAQVYYTAVMTDTLIEED